MFFFRGKIALHVAPNAGHKAHATKRKQIVKCCPLFGALFTSLCLINKKKSTFIILKSFFSNKTIYSSNKIQNHSIK